MRDRLLAFLFALLGHVVVPVVWADEPVYGPELQGFDYPAPVSRHTFEAQGQTLQMAYLDYTPAKPNGQSVVLLHGKNFCAATWHGTATLLQSIGFRVIAPDQVGFCKSSKPSAYAFSLQGLAENTHGLLASLRLSKVTVIGHSMGGMLATRYALMYPQDVTQLVLINPLGLEDWKAKGVPSPSVDEWYARELKLTDERMRNYQRNTYYAQEWKPEYEPWVQMIAGMFRGSGKETVARQSALTYVMIMEQPVVHEFAQLQVPTLLLIGEKDNTAVGKEFAAPSVQSQLGHYRALSFAAIKAIPGARLVLFPDLGHAPHIQNPDRFHTALVNSLVALEKD